jgi:hypothetical protein
LLSQRIKCAELESWCLGMLRECLVFSSMRLGVSFIAPRQLGAVESIPGRQFLPSVAWRIGQSGAPLDTVRCGFLSFFGEADRWRFRAVGAPDSPVIYSCTPPIKPESSQFARASLAHRTLSDAPPDSPVHPDCAESWLLSQVFFKLVFSCL